MSVPQTAQEYYEQGARLLNSGDVSGAVVSLTKAAELRPGPQTIGALGMALMRGGNFDSALSWFSRLDENNAHDVRTLTLQGQAFEGLGKFDEAVARYRTCLNASPLQIPVLRRYSELAWPRDREDVLKRFDATCALITEETPHGLLALQLAAQYQEFAARQDNGQASGLGTSLDDLFFRYATEARDRVCDLARRRLEKSGTDTQALAALAFYFMSQHDWERAGDYYARLKKAQPDDIDLMMFIDADYAARLDRYDADAVSEVLPAVHHVRPLDDSPAGTLFLASSLEYAEKFTMPLLLSLEDQGVAARVQVHVMAEPGETISVLEAALSGFAHVEVGLSWEIIDLKTIPHTDSRNYFHAIRYVRAAQAVQSSGGAVVLMDVDGLVNADPKRIFDVLNGGDAGVCVIPAAWIATSQMRGDFAAFAPTAKGRAYAWRIAAFITDAFDRDALFWAIDQNALFTVHAEMEAAGHAPDLKVFGPNVYSQSADPEAVFWSSAGKEKFRDIATLQTGTADETTFAGNPFMQKYARYHSMARDRLAKARD